MEVSLTKGKEEDAELLLRLSAEGEADEAIVQELWSSPFAVGRGHDLRVKMFVLLRCSERQDPRHSDSTS